MLERMPESLAVGRENLKALPSIPGGWTTRVLEVGGRAFRLTLPADPDAFLKDPEVHAAHDRCEYMPYWPYLWPAALSMAQLVQDDQLLAGRRVLEIGAGIGLVGLAALARGCHVTFNDNQQSAVDLALYNARQNGFTRVAALCFDWSEPPPVRFPAIIGCEVTYDPKNHGSILDLVETTLEAGGVAWFGDPCRQQTEKFIAQAKARGFEVKRTGKHVRQITRPPAGRFQLIGLSRTA